MKPRQVCRLIAPAAFAFAAVLFAGIGQAPAFQGEPRGFGGFVWGTPRENLGSMTHVGTDCAGNVTYRRQGETADFGRARLAAIEYGFRDGRLAGVTLRVDSLFQYLLMKDEAIRRYGEGEEISGQRDSYVWSGENTYISLVSHFTDS